MSSAIWTGVEWTNLSDQLCSGAKVVSVWDLAPSDPRLVGPYRTRAVLGEGGMGRVLLATDAGGELAAVKLVQGAFAAYDDSFRQRLHLEALAAQRVESPHTARVIKADANAGVPWLAYEFHHGPTLRQALNAAGPLNEDTALHLAAGLTTALRDIHAHNYIHRDLSPSNVLLTTDGPVVIDFGVVRPTHHSDDTSHHTRAITITRTGTVIGNPGFMSPEQAMGVSHLTPASDLFALGTVLVMATTGHNPFQGATSEQTRLNIMTREPDLHQVPPRLRRIIEPCFARNHTDRPNATDILQSIGALPRTHRPWPQPIHQLIEDQKTEVQRYAHIDPTAILPGPRELDPTKIFTSSREPGSTSGAGSRAKRSRQRLIAVVAATVVVVAGVLWTVVSSGRSGADDAPGAGTSQDPSPKVDHAFANTTQGDCFRNAGDMQIPDFRAADCDGDVFEAVRIFKNTTDLSVCNYVDRVEWRYSARNPDVTVCLVYQHSGGTAYNADQGDCVYGESEDTVWSLEECRSGNFTVVARFEGRSSTQDCEEVPDHQQSRYFTVSGMPELNVRLCLALQP
ncbi:serine/threonine protein kinase [Streptomyces sp. PSKA54]|uniref:Serine/threonine protein kinase n=1 Tax=Streptomyces himalayensis subsp. aureolus TaxID=2758039 RepID=A0A7W2D233_9ACTN|nr:serine/threonine-protein kinase [Streptomyces himalayensis]MBA4863359.1 serine/threonine protein kinase [Streptomyces himalayensis subsp. aureolus]